MDSYFQIFNRKTRVFVSYARKDRAMCSSFLKIVIDDAIEGIAELWIDDELEPGTEWDKTIKEALSHAEVILLLLTPSFLESDYCVNIEGKQALKQGASGQSKVIGIILDDCNYADYGFDVVKLLPESGTLLNIPSSVKNYFAKLLWTMKQSAEISLETKYIIYKEFEKKNKKIEFNGGLDGYFDEPTCELVSEHLFYGNEFSTKRGAYIWIATGAILITAIGFALLQLLHEEQLEGFFEMLLFMVEIGIIAYVVATGLLWIERKCKFRIETFGPLYEDSSPKFFFHGLVGLLAGLAYGLPISLLSYLIFGTLSWLGVLIICVFFGVLIFVNVYDESRKKRLQIYQDLVLAGKEPEGGWLIESVIEEVRTYKEEWIRKRYTDE